MIPKQLKESDFKFILVKPKAKIPLEVKWTTENNYPFDDWKLEKHTHYNKNYGVLGGEGNLIMVDFDSQSFQDKFLDKLPNTFSVMTGSGLLHLYFKTDDTKSFKVFDDAHKTLCDVQGKGKFVVAPGSIHPNGTIYKVVNDVDINYIKHSDLKYLFRDYLSKDVEDKKIKKSSIEKDYVIKQIKEKINLPQLLEGYGIDTTQNPTQCPWHSSARGKCLSFDDNTFYCFHCLETGNIFHFVMKQESCNFVEAKRILMDKVGVQEQFKFTQFDKYTNTYRLMQEFIKEQPIYYDRSLMWWIWNHGDYKWEIIDKTDIINLININTQHPTISSNIRDEILESLRQLGRLNKPKPIKPSWIQFKNKIIDYETGEEFEATPEYFITNPIPWELGDMDETLTMDLIFEDWVGKENVKLLYEIIAYCLIPDYPIHRIFCLLGGGLNGKTSFLNLLKKFIGNYNCTSTELDILLKSRFEITKLHKKLVCIMGETNFNVLSQTSTLKKLVGGDLIGFEYKNKNPFDEVNYAKILIATNNLPATADKTLGFYRRWIIIDFPNRFSEKKDILKSIPKIEFNNLARKSIMILKDIIEKREFYNEGSIEERERKYEDKSNPMEKFWKENIEEDFNGFVFKYELEGKLDDFCIEHKYRKLSDGVIKKHMKEKGIGSGRKYTEWYTDEGNKKQYWAWIGIKIKEKNKTNKTEKTRGYT